MDKVSVITEESGLTKDCSCQVESRLIDLRNSGNQVSYNMEKKIKVLVVDDTAIMRNAVTQILQEDPMIQVLGSAKNGLDALDKIKCLRPDVVTLDIDMPVMNGLSAIRHIMIESPVPIVILSSLIRDGSVIFEALRLGVVDFVPKPSTALSMDIDGSKQQITDRIKTAVAMTMENVHRVRLARKWNTTERVERLYKFYPLEYIIVIGTTLSGPNTVIRLLSKLSPTIPATVIVHQEISPKVILSFAREFNEHVPWKVEVAEHGEVVEQGTCYISSNEYSLSIRLNEKGEACLNSGAGTDHPLDLLFSSAASIFRSNTIGILLSGVGDDGAEGFAEIKRKSGTTMVKAVRCCVFPNLTDNAIQKGVVDIALNDHKLPGTIEALMTNPNLYGKYNE